MKKFITFITTFLLFPCAFAQEGPAPDGQSFTEERDSLYMALDKSRIPHSVLYDRVFPFAGLTEIESGDTVTAGLWIQGLSELQRATYGPAPTDNVLNKDNVHDFIRSENIKNRIPLLVLNARFSTIDTMAVYDGRLTLNAGLYGEGSNNGVSPYITQSITMGALGLLEALEMDKPYTMYFTEGYGFGTAEASVTGVAVTNQTTGQNWNLSVGQELAITFNHEGTNVLDIAISLSGGGIRHYIQFVDVAKTSSYEDNCKGPVELVASDFGYYGTQGVGEYQIFYATNNPAGCTFQLNKPIIIVDGFDPEDEREIDEIYTTKLAYGVQSNLADQLRAKGYDVVILNFPNKALWLASFSINIYGQGPTVIDVYQRGGADFIERNSLVFVELVKRLNTQLQTNGSSEKLVVVGPSMGGQITRHGLRKMELDGLDHNTRLWVSFDSPHWGANIPYGFQEMIRVLSEKLEIAATTVTYTNQLQAPAARQMLIHQTLPGGVQGFLPWDPNLIGSTSIQKYKNKNNEQPERLAWRNTLHTIGYPQNLRKIAIANGISTGGIYHNPGGKMFLMETKSRRSAKLLSTIKPYFASSTSAPIFDIWKFFTGTFYSYGAISTIYGPLDGSPGGIYDVQQEFYDESLATVINPPWPYGFALNSLYDRTNNISFIPTVSALGINDPNFLWTNSLNIGNLKCNQLTPFDNIYTAPGNNPFQDNERHVEITQGNVDFLMNELDPIGTITGSDYPKACNQSLYTLNASFPAGSSLSWSTNDPFILQPVSTGFILVKPKYAGVVGTFTATITYPNCVERTVSFTTKGTTDAIYTLRFTGLPNCNYQATVSPAAAGDSYRWSANGWYNYYNSSPTFYPPGTSGYIPGTGAQVWLRVDPGVCQSSVSPYIYLTKVFNRTTSGCDPDPEPSDPNYPSFRLAAPAETSRVEAFPNPSTSDWRLIITNPRAKNIEATLKDAAGRTLWSKRTTEGVSGIPVVPGEELSAGVYLLYLRIEGTAYQLKLVKQ